MTKEQQDRLRRALYNAKFTTDAEDENPFVGVYFNDLLTIIKDYVEQPVIDNACEWLEKYAANFVALPDEGQQPIGDTNAIYGTKSLLYYLRKEMEE